ncbi:MAG: tRNA-dihydrouridine synthase [Patescibacteria group bacterium]
MKEGIIKGFWGKLPRPFFILAPMADVTDSVFRRLISERGKPDVMYTEFVSADGLCSSGKENLLMDLEYSEGERPIVAQLFSSHPEKMKEASALCAKLQFDGIDINMGCPDRSIEKQRAGAMMIKTPEIAREIIRAAKEGAPGLPISVKTRLGYNSDVLEEWLQVLLEENLSAITIHARTRKDMSKVPARWERVKRAVEIRELSGKETLIIGNGDVHSLEEGRRIAEETGCDGIMIGRGIFWNPWVFSEREPSIEERFLAVVEHTKRFEEKFSVMPHFSLNSQRPRLNTPSGRPSKSFAVMKKHFKAYVEGFSGAKDLRVKLMEAENAKGVEEIVQKFLNEKQG